VDYAKNEKEVYEACCEYLSTSSNNCPEDVQNYAEKEGKNVPLKVFKKEDVATQCFCVMQEDKRNRSSRLDKALLGLTKKHKFMFYSDYYWLC
jgi:hypothetical protein